MFPPQPSLPSVRLRGGSPGWVLAVPCSWRGEQLVPSDPEGPVPRPPAPASAPSPRLRSHEPSLCR